MDSLTQIVLGAACGEIALGKKIGNKALLFGAIGGTIPDLDVFIGRWFHTSEIAIMAFHRGFMHSILFSVLGAFLFGWLFFAETITIATVAGAMMIVAGCLLAARRGPQEPLNQNLL